MSTFDQQQQNVQKQFNAAGNIFVYENAPTREVDEETLAKANARLAELPLDEIPQVTTLPRGSWMPHSPNPLFVGREENLQELARALKAGQAEAVAIAPAIAAATGMGGIGKTQLAAEFAHRYGTFFAGGVFWISLAEPNAVEAEIAACALEGGPEIPPGAATLPIAEQVRAVLSTWKSPLPRLLIFDNCEDPALLAQWRPPTGGCRVLVTSRRGSWPVSMGVQTLPLHTLPRPDSIALLRKFRADLPEGTPALNAIAQELGDLPLALHLAGSFLARYRNAVSPEAYLSQLQSPQLLQHDSLQGRGDEHSPTGHERHVARTFAMSYDALKRESEVDQLARAFLFRAACFAPGEPIPRYLLKLTNIPSSRRGKWSLKGFLQGLHNMLFSSSSPHKGDSERGDGDEQALVVENALARLVELGLLEEEASDALKLHRLLASFVKNLSLESLAEAQQAVEEAVLKEARRLNNAGYPAPLLAWQTHLRHVTEVAYVREDEIGADLCSALDFHLDMLADYLGARPYSERALAIRQKVLGAEHPDTARSLNNLGALLRAQGDYAGARPHFEQALAIRQKVLGAEHPDTAGSLNNLGVLCFYEGNLPESARLIRQAFVIREKRLGPNHPDTVSSKENLAFIEARLRGE